MMLVSGWLVVVLLFRCVDVCCCVVAVVLLCLRVSVGLLVWVCCCWFCAVAGF